LQFVTNKFAMSIQQPSIPKGTRDFSPKEMVKRNYIFDTIRKVFTLYGYQPLETPAMENLSTLMGKYGEEGDKLLFKILNSGDFLSDIQTDDLNERNTAKLANKLCEKGLRYDLTVPFARFVVQYRNEITFPFKRYQIQPVWRADRPQKGRYREFYQCDVDVVGSNSLLNETELIQIIDRVFEKLDVNVTIKLNNRKILTGIAEVIGESAKITDITVAIDKIDKIGVEKVNEELAAKELSIQSIEKLQPILALKGSNEEKLERLQVILQDSAIGLKGIEEIKDIFGFVKSLSLKTPIDLDITLARGLNYYTGAIFEVKAQDVAIGSICGGGRYDNLTGIFGLPDVSGVGISFGADRIYDVLHQLDKYPKEVAATSKLMFVNFGNREALYCMKQMTKLRGAGIATELYPENTKMKKQFAYADSKQIPFVGIVGEDEINENVVTLKNMQSGEQKKLTTEELIKELSAK
jgi:histidyl-tRNA synthetase